MKNKTKTMLFASLIAAMILPFSMMDSAAAEKQYNISDRIDQLILKYNNLEDKRQSLKAKLTIADTEEKREKISAKIAKVEARQDRIEAKAVALSEQEAEYAPSQDSDSLGAITSGDEIAVYDMHGACDNPTINSAPETVIGAINVDRDVVSWNWAIPDAKSVGWFYPFCTNVYYEEVHIFTRNNSERQSCTLVKDNVEVGTAEQTCNCGIDTGDFLSWSVQTTYEPLSGKNNEGNKDWRGLHRVS